MMEFKAFICVHLWLEFEFPRFKALKKRPIWDNEKILMFSLAPGEPHFRLRRFRSFGAARLPETALVGCPPSFVTYRANPTPIQTKFDALWRTGVPAGARCW
jgi:hypothetical protein